MPHLRVYGFTDEKGRLGLQSLNHPIGEQALTIVSNGMLHAIVGAEPTAWPWQDSAEQTLRRLITYHRVLGECASKIEKIIPASFESVFTNLEAIYQALALHQRDILDLLGQYGATRQFQLTVKWDLQAMQKTLKKHGHKADGLEHERKMLRDQLLFNLQGKLQDIIILDHTDKELVVQAVLLVNRDDEARLISVLQSFDDNCKGRLNLKLIGPLPALNFARVELRLPDTKTVQEACRTLGIGNAARLSDVKNAYRRQAKISHPDKNSNRIQGAPHDQMVRLTQSYRYLTRLAAQQNGGVKTNPDQQWIRCDSKNLSQTPLLRIQRGLTRWDDALMKRH